MQHKCIIITTTQYNIESYYIQHCCLSPPRYNRRIQVAKCLALAERHGDTLETHSRRNLYTNNDMFLLVCLLLWVFFTIHVHLKGGHGCLVLQRRDGSAR